MNVDRVIIWEPTGDPFRWKTTRGEPDVLQQVDDVAKLPVVDAVRLMPDGHKGFGGPVGGVVVTTAAIIPAVVGVDLNCGMIGARTTIDVGRLVNLPRLRAAIEAVQPVGGPGTAGSWREARFGGVPDTIAAEFIPMAQTLAALVAKHPKLVAALPSGKTRIQPEEQALTQLGTLGTGNHFIEVCVEEPRPGMDPFSSVWVLLHSGSRGIGARLAEYFISEGWERLQQNPDVDTSEINRDLAWLPASDPLFEDYVAALDFTDRYATTSRRLMLDRVMRALEVHVGPFSYEMVANCHHNYVRRETHFARDYYVTRKGAVSAQAGEIGIIPGSMGARSFIVRGLGNPESFMSCSHGAGRRLPRGEAKRTLTLEQHALATAGVECRQDLDVIDESPACYKDIDAVMAAQRDLVEPIHTLKQVVCVKG